MGESEGERNLREDEEGGKEGKKEDCCGVSKKRA